MPRILWVSDSPLLATGFGRVTFELTTRLGSVPGIEIACLGWGHDGWPVEPDRYPLRIYPGSHGNQTQGFDRAIAEYRPDIVISLGEIWMMQWLSQHPARAQCRWVAYFPVDSGPLYPPWEPMLMGIDEIVTMADFGRAVIHASLPSKRLHTIHHGVNPEVFRPLDDREQLKSHPRYRGRFVVGCVARNQPRKNIPALIKAFALLKDRIPELHLYLHMDPCDVGHDLVTLLRRYGLQGRADITSPGFALNDPLPDADLNRLYNLFDLMVLPTQGEGFGLPIIESMAAGTPVIATDCSACSELVRGRGELARVLTTLTTGTNLVEHAIVDVEDLAARIEHCHRNPGLMEQYSRTGRAFAETLSWDRLIPCWVNLIESVAGGQTPAARVPQPVLLPSENSVASGKPV